MCKVHFENMLNLRVVGQIIHSLTYYLALLMYGVGLRVSYEIHFMMQAYKDWILRTIENTWNLFDRKFVALWDTNKDSGDAYLPAIYNNPGLLQLVQKKYIKDLLHDSLGFGAAKMIR